MNFTIKKNKFKVALKEHKTMFALWQGIPNTTVAEIGAGAGFDWVLIDAEHAPFNVPAVMAHLQAVEPYPVSALVRPVEGNAALIKQLLDIGAQTLLVPMVNSAEQAKQIVQAAKYPPEGIRGLGTSMARAANWNRTSNYLHKANDQICVIVQIETQEAMDNIESIVAVDGVDAVFIGPSDLSAAMGHIGNPGHPDVVAAVEKAFDVINKSGKSAGVLAVTPDLVKKYQDAGAKFIGVGVDVSLLANAAQKLASQYIDKVDESETQGY